MTEKSFVAKREDRLSSAGALIRHLIRLQNLHLQHIFDAAFTRQENWLSLLASNHKITTLSDWRDYLIDASQRSILLLDTLRQRGDNTLAYRRANYPLLLKFSYEVLLDGRTLARPVNYSLLRIIPDAGEVIDDSLPPIIIIDPRGGHGAGIGGFKEDSIVGESLRAGHPTYFVAFGHAPEPGQTLIDIGEAEAKFVELVIDRHPQSDKPVVIGNCQAGWALMGLAAHRPELPGLVIINGAPLSYWAGVTGRNPMRYVGGLCGGAWMTRLGSDIGNGRFDGNWLVGNFESLNPSNTLWGKYYKVYAEIDTESERFLDFERWWGSPTLLNSEEIESIVDDLFIGNRLSGANPRKTTSIDLRHIEAPVVVFCSSGDNIVPPQQALNWISDIYPNDLALHASGHTIVYLAHADIGHLGIFVSGAVARREHHEMIGAVAAIKALPPGLFEMLIEDLPPAADGAPDYRVRFEARKIADILNDDPDGREDECELALVDRVSDVNSTLYEWFIRPWLSQVINEQAAEATRRLHPFQLQQVAWCSLNPLMYWVPAAATIAQQQRRPADADNPLFGWQQLWDEGIRHSLDLFRDTRDASVEFLFHLAYGALSIYTGKKSVGLPPPDKNSMLTQLRDELTRGGVIDAAIRILLILGHAAGGFDKELLEHVVAVYRSHAKETKKLPDHDTLHRIARLQNMLVLAYPEQSLRTLSQLLSDRTSRSDVLAGVATIVPDWCNSDGPAGKKWQELLQTLYFTQSESVPSATANTQSLQGKTSRKGKTATARRSAKKSTSPPTESIPS